jgi:DNA-binding NarL/FixJ family response regulator
LAGRIYVSEEVLAADAKGSRRPERKSPVRSIDRLSDLELEILGLLGGGKSNEEVASQLGLTSLNLERRYAEMQKKLRLKNANALVRFAVRWQGSGEDSV